MEDASKWDKTKVPNEFILNYLVADGFSLAIAF
jgi:hypothetical protein